METIVKQFRLLASMTVRSVGEHVLAVPGRHEAKALTDACPECEEFVQPATVLDVAYSGRTRERLASYRCAECGAAWLCSWSPPRQGAIRRE